MLAIGIAVAAMRCGASAPTGFAFVTSGGEIVSSGGIFVTARSA